MVRVSGRFWRTEYTGSRRIVVRCRKVECTLAVKIQSGLWCALSESLKFGKCKGLGTRKKAGLRRSDNPYVDAEEANANNLSLFA